MTKTHKTSYLNWGALLQRKKNVHAKTGESNDSERFLDDFFSFHLLLYFNGAANATLHLGHFTNTNHSKHLCAIQLIILPFCKCGWGGEGARQGVNMLSGSDTAFSIKASHNISMFSNQDQFAHLQTCKLVEPTDQTWGKWMSSALVLPKHATALRNVWIKWE